MIPIKDTPLPTSITLQTNGSLVVIQKGESPQIYTDPEVATSIICYCIENEWTRRKTQIGVIYCNWWK